ncbi:unnamed protein product [Dovyalis caffra]|uniref:Uncharacterized protein n=1 Tax=Dovyalis caffra TaxID=77055 RepID=A0AAV1R327_9ROSI|nr:unnamed protein product [Dovyalis caffra]
MDVATFRFPTPNGRDPFREFDDEFTCKISLRLHKLEGSGLVRPWRFCNLSTVSGTDPVNLLPYKCNTIQFLKFPISLGLPPLMLKSAKENCSIEAEKFPIEIGRTPPSGFSVIYLLQGKAVEDLEARGQCLPESWLAVSEMTCIVEILKIKDYRRNGSIQAVTWKTKLMQFHSSIKESVPHPCHDSNPCWYLHVNVVESDQTKILKPAQIGQLIGILPGKECRLVCGDVG